MTTNTDVRKWAREHGIPVTNRGPIAAELRERYEAEHGDGTADPIVFGGPGYDGGVTEADFPPALEDRADPRIPAEAPEAPADVDDHQAQTPARQEETRPKKVTAPNAFQRWRDRNKPKAAARAGAGRKRARVSLAGLIEDTWSQMAWAATPLPPMQRLLHAQAPMAGIALEDALRGTMVDKALQPFARAEDKAKAVGGLMLPPMALMGVLATAPQPQQVQTDDGPAMAWPEPSIQHKGALLTLRWSLMLMAETGAAHLEEYQAKAEAAAVRAEQADRFMAWLLGWEEPAPPEGAEQEEEAVARARAMFGEAPGDTG